MTIKNKVSDSIIDYVEPADMLQLHGVPELDERRMSPILPDVETESAEYANEKRRIWRIDSLQEPIGIRILPPLYASEVARNATRS